MKMIQRSFVAVCALLSLQVSALQLHGNPIGPDGEFITKIPVATGHFRCTDNNTGSGFIMFSEQPVNERWTEDKAEADFRKHTAKNFVCVRYNNSRWEYDTNWADEPNRTSNVSWHIFIPRASDILVAVFDYAGGHITNLAGAFKYAEHKGMAIGYAYGDLNFFPNRNSSNGTDAGEVAMNGTYIVPFIKKKGIMSPTTTMKAPILFANASVKYSVQSGGISCTDGNNGSGFIMWTETPVNKRWDLDKTENDFRRHTASNFVCVRYQDNTWQYDANWEDEQDRASNVSWHVFMPKPSDVLVASVDYEADSVMDLRMSNMTYKGIQAGYRDGDLVFFANQSSSGEEDAGEFRISGSFIIPYRLPNRATTTTTTTSVTGPTTTPIYGIYNPTPNLTQVNEVSRKVVSGVIRCTDDNLFPGFIMYSVQDKNLRFLDPKGMPRFRPTTVNGGHNMLCVRFKKDRWQFDTNARDEKHAKLFSHSWVDFSPLPTDVVVAAVDFPTSRVKTLVGVRARSYGMQFGFHSANFKIKRAKSMGDYKVSGGTFISWGHPI